MLRCLLGFSLAAALAVALAGAAGGCHTHPYRAGVHIHSDGCGHYYWHGGWYAYAHPASCSICYPDAVTVTHVHGDGCGHVFWHGAWHAGPHPAGCTLCAAPPASAVVIASSDPPPGPAPTSVVYAHVHSAGCGHYFWHDAWWGWPHPGHCDVCIAPAFLYPRVYVSGPRVSVGLGVGFGFGHRHGHRRCR